MKFEYPFHMILNAYKNLNIMKFAVSKSSKFSQTSIFNVIPFVLPTNLEQSISD
jgi:hypothetical protein